MMSGINTISAIVHGTAQASAAMDQARAAQQAANRDRDMAVYDACSDQYLVRQGGELRIIPREVAPFHMAETARTGYAYPAETPPDWVAQEDAKDRELDRWIAEVLP